MFFEFGKPFVRSFEDAQDKASNWGQHDQCDIMSKTVLEATKMQCHFHWKHDVFFIK